MSIAGISHRVASSIAAAERPLSNREILDKLRSISASQIEAMSLLVVEKIFRNLGAVGRARVAGEVMEIKGGVKIGPEALRMRMTMVRAQMMLQRGQEQFLSKETSPEFLRQALQRVIPKITHAFSKPEFFLEFGISLPMSGDQPSYLLHEIANAAGVPITLMDVPAQYWVFLTLDLASSRDDLVFVLKETSEDVEFSRQTFALKDLGMRASL